MIFYNTAQNIFIKIFHTFLKRNTQHIFIYELIVIKSTFLYTVQI